MNIFAKLFGMAETQPNRRKNDSEHEQMAADRNTKRIIIISTCSSYLGIIFTLCYLAVWGKPPLDAVVIKEIAIFLGGSLFGLLGKAGVDRISSSDATPPTATEIGTAVSDAAAVQPLAVTETDTPKTE